jgi:hypothetical protein
MNRTKLAPSSTLIRSLALAMAALLAGCSDEGAAGTGRVQVFVVPEETIPEGLTPGDGDESITDGWTVTYDKFVVTFGNFRASRSAEPGVTLTEPKVTVLDLTKVPANGVILAEFADVAAVRWDRVGFDLPNATASAVKEASVEAEDYQRMLKEGLSLFVRGRIEKADGQSCDPKDPTMCVDAKAIDFEFALAAGTSFDDCAPADGDAGFAVPTGGTAQVEPTIHGDHWFFNNVTQGAEITERRAQWLADADRDGDGKVDLIELSTIKASDLFRAPTYNLSGGIIPIETAADWVEAQARTLGDFQGDGECPTRKTLSP